VGEVVWSSFQRLKEFGRRRGLGVIYQEGLQLGNRILLVGVSKFEGGGEEKFPPEGQTLDPVTEKGTLVGGQDADSLTLGEKTTYGMGALPEKG